jgi:pyruvate/oxaloacetate carboxyltransferase
MKNPVKISEVVLRDGQQSHIATRMRTEDMIPIAQQINKAGYYAAEVWGGATYEVCVRYLREDPWERLRILRRLMPDVKLRVFLRSQTLVGYWHYPDDVVEAFVERAAANGIDIFRVYDILDDLRNCETTVRAAHACGKIVEGQMQYAISPIHDLDFYLKLARWWQDLGADALAIEDASGILGPSQTYSLIKALKTNFDLPVHLHCHSLSGMSSMTYMAAVDAGVDYLDTSISSFSNGTSLPPTESIVAALQGTPRDTGLDLQELDKINDYFVEIGAKYKDFRTSFVGIDPKVLRYQLPGGMISNLEQQLRDQNHIDKLPQIFEEVPSVRKDLGFVFLATPFSQMVGTQSIINVITGERYKIIVKEIVDYLKGKYGKPPGLIDSDLLKKALKGEKPITCRPADLLENCLDKLRDELGQDTSLEDLITYALFPKVAKEFFKERVQI